MAMNALDVKSDKLRFACLAVVQYMYSFLDTLDCLLQIRSVVR